MGQKAGHRRLKNEYGRVKRRQLSPEPFCLASGILPDQFFLKAAAVHQRLITLLSNYLLLCHYHCTFSRYLICQTRLSALQGEIASYPVLPPWPWGPPNSHPAPVGTQCLCVCALTSVRRGQVMMQERPADPRGFTQ